MLMTVMRKSEGMIKRDDADDDNPCGQVKAENQLKPDDGDTAAQFPPTHLPKIQEEPSCMKNYKYYGLSILSPS